MDVDETQILLKTVEDKCLEFEGIASVQRHLIFRAAKESFEKHKSHQICLKSLSMVIASWNKGYVEHIFEKRGKKWKVLSESSNLAEGEYGDPNLVYKILQLLMVRNLLTKKRFGKRKYFILEIFNLEQSWGPICLMEKIIQLSSLKHVSESKKAEMINEFLTVLWKHEQRTSTT